jgi:outer membrane lipoprotein-sorting protein
MSSRSNASRRPVPGALPLSHALAATAACAVLAAAVAGPARAGDTPETKAAKPPASATATATLAAKAPEQPASFSVEMEVKKGDQTFTMKRTVDGGKLRMDITGQGHDMSLIQLDDEKRTMYTISPERKMVMKQSMAATMERVGQHEAKTAEAKPADKAEPAASAPGGGIEFVGQETIDGKAADKYKVTTPEGDGTMWVDAQNNLPLRMESGDGVVEFKNYQFGPQPPELFQPPKGMEVKDYDALMANMPKNMMSGMMSGMASQMGGGLGGSLGGSLGGALGGPLGSMVGHYVGQKIGQSLGHKVAGGTPGK